MRQNVSNDVDNLSTTIFTRLMPIKDVAVNGQVKYVPIKKATSLKMLSYSRLKGINMLWKDIRKNISIEDVLYASCFADGIYRYPTPYSTEQYTVDKSSLILKMDLFQLQGTTIPKISHVPHFYLECIIVLNHRSYFHLVVFSNYRQIWW